LVIARRIFALHGAEIDYQHDTGELNRFVVKFTQ
jgi:hypothetical protein